MPEIPMPLLAFSNKSSLMKDQFPFLRLLSIPLEGMDKGKEIASHKS